MYTYIRQLFKKTFKAHRNNVSIACISSLFICTKYNNFNIDISWINYKVLGEYR